VAACQAGGFAGILQVRPTGFAESQALRSRSHQTRKPRTVKGLGFRGTIRVRSQRSGERWAGALVRPTPPTGVLGRPPVEPLAEKRTR
jgi:hypothetical protein